MDCTITVTHSAMCDLPEIHSIKTHEQPSLQVLVTDLHLVLLAIYLKTDSK